MPRRPDVWHPVTFRVVKKRQRSYRSDAYAMVEALRTTGTNSQQPPERSKNMPLVQVVLVLIVVGVLLWLVDRFIPMASSIKSIMNAVVVIAVVLWLLNIFGLLHSLSAIHIGKP
jgi:hypothetical protein